MKPLLIMFLTAAAGVGTLLADAFNNLDSNQDGKLSIEELPKPLQPSFGRVDRNQDGTISRQEEAAFRQRVNHRPTQPGGGGGRIREGYRAEVDIPYAGTDNVRQTLNLYLPEQKSDKPMPLVVWIHGGGWQNGDKSSGASRLMPFMDGEVAGASIGYRLTDESSWPDQIHDCKAAIRWLRGNADKYGFDPDRIAVWGSSAGGHLVALLGTSGGVEELEGELGDFDSFSSRVSCVVDYCGPADFLTIEGSYDREGSPVAKLLGGLAGKREAVAAQASPVSHVSRDDPPFLIVHGDSDPVVPWDQSVKLDQLLDEAGVPSILVRVMNGGHSVPQQEVLPRVKRFIQKYLLEQGGEDPSEEPVTVQAAPVR